MTNIGVNSADFNSKVWNLLQSAAPQLVADIAESKRRFEHKELEEALGLEAAGALTNIVRQGLWDDDYGGYSMTIPLGDTGRALVISDGSNTDYPNTDGLCIMVNPKVD